MPVNGLRTGGLSLFDSYEARGLPKVLSRLSRHEALMAGYTGFIGGFSLF